MAQLRVAIIGGAGFVGRNLAVALDRAGHKVIVFDAAPGGDFAAQRYTIRRLELPRDPIEFEHNTDVVFYLAQSPFYHGFPEHADHLFGVNVLGCIVAAQAARDQGVRFFCYASTGNVYQASFDALAETHPVRRGDPYALSKVMAEEALALFSGHMIVTSARFFGIFGPGQRKMLPWKLFEFIKERKPIILEGAVGVSEDTEGLLISFCYVDDAIQSLIKLATIGVANQTIPSVINIAGPEPISVRRFASAIGQVVGIEPIFEMRPETRSFNLIADISLMRSILAPTFVPFDEAISSTYRGLV